MKKEKLIKAIIGFLMIGCGFYFWISYLDSANEKAEILFEISNPSKMNIDNASLLVGITPIEMTKNIQLQLSGILYNDSSLEYRFFLQRTFFSFYDCYENKCLYISYYPDSTNMRSYEDSVRNNMYNIREIRMEPLPNTIVVKENHRGRYHYSDLASSFIVPYEMLQQFKRGRIVKIGFGRGNEGAMSLVRNKATAELGYAFTILNEHLHSDVNYDLINYGPNNKYKDLIHDIGLFKSNVVVRKVK